MCCAFISDKWAIDFCFEPSLHLKCSLPFRQQPSRLLSISGPCHIVYSLIFRRGRVSRFDYTDGCSCQSGNV
jgi:hypothetical protein